MLGLFTELHRRVIEFGDTGGGGEGLFSSSLCGHIHGTLCRIPHLRASLQRFFFFLSAPFQIPSVDQIQAVPIHFLCIPLLRVLF